MSPARQLCAAALLLLIAVHATAEPYAPDERTLLLDHLDVAFEPDGRACTSPQVINPAGDVTGGRPMKGGQFVEGQFGKALRFSGLMNMVYPAQGNISMSAGMAEFRLALNFDAGAIRKNPPSHLRNQLFFTVFGPKRSRVVIYSTLGHICLGVWDQRQQLVCYGNYADEWKQDEWHHIQLRWGRRLELWADGKPRIQKDWTGLFGPLDVRPDELQVTFGSHTGYSNVHSEFTLDEVRILGPGGEQIPAYPVMSCPRITAPAIDGRVEEAEWRAAAQSTGFLALQENVLVDDQTTVYTGWDDDALYVAAVCADAQKRPIIAMMTGRDAGIYREDAFDIFLAPSPKTYPYYQLIANPLGTRYDSRVDPAGAVRSDTAFNPDWTVKTTRGEGTWSLEARIPFAEVDGLQTPRDGERWRINFCRDADSGSRLSSWAFVDGNFHRPANFGELIFLDSDRSVRLGNLGDWSLGRLEATLAMTGLAFDPLVTVKSSLVDQNAKTLVETENRLADYKSVTVKSPALVSGLYTLTLSAATDGGELYYQRIPFRVQKDYDISVETYPYEGKLWVTANVSGLEAAAEGVIAKSSLVQGDRIIASCEATQFRQGRGEAAIDIASIPAGKYSVKSSAVAPDGSVLGEADTEVELFDKPVWWRSKAGTEPTVPSPWTPVQVAEGSISVWGREYIGTRFLPSQIANQESHMLAAPISLRLKSGGASADLAQLPAKQVDASDVQAVHETSTTCGAVGVQARRTTEFDGMQRYDFTLTPEKPTQVDELILEIPVDKRFASFLLPSNGRSANGLVLDGTPWRSPFMPQVWVGNDDIGLAWFAESDQYWTPQDDAMVEVLPGDEATVIRCGIVRQPLTLSEPITFTFGLLPTPVKRIPVADPFWFRFAGPLGDIRKLDDPSASGRFAEFLVYPGDGNVDPAQGTAEFWLAPGLAAGGALRDVAQIGGAAGRMELTLQHANTGKLTLTVVNGEETKSVVASGIDWPVGQFKHVAVTWDDATSLFVDGKHYGDVDIALPDSMGAADAKPTLQFGCRSDRRGYSDIALDELRISKTVRYTPELLPATGAPFTPDGDTLLLDHLDDEFVPDGEDGETLAAVVAGASDELGGVPSIGCRSVDGRFGKACLIAVQPPISSADFLKQLGANANLFWAWYEALPSTAGWPPPLFKEPLYEDYRAGLKQLGDMGIPTVPYMAYTGIGAPSDVSTQFGDEWSRRPLSTIPSEPPKGHFFLDCCGRSGFADYLAAGAQWLMEDLGFQGCYTDGNAHAYPCKNTHHGCGYHDDKGILHATWPIFPTREYLKRMYRVIHTKREDGFLVNHVSYNTLIPTMSFTDVYYSGEHEQYEDLIKFRVRWQSKQWGIWPILLGADAHAWRSMHMTYGLLHATSVWPQGNLGRNDMLRKTANVWQAYDRFGYRDAEWVPYYRAQPGIVASDSDNVKVSLYKHPDGRALLIVGNLSHEVRTAALQLDFSMLGFEPTRARNALTNRELPLDGRALSVRLRPASFVLAWVE